MSFFSDITIKDSANLDAFSRLRVSQPQGLFDGQFTYNLLPLQFESVVSGTGASATHDATNRCASLAFSSTPTGGSAYLQSYEYMRYQPGKSQAAFVTFNFIEPKANVVKFAGLSDGTNGVEFQLNGSTPQFVLYSGTGNGNQTKAQADWNIDKLNGSGPSGLTLDLTMAQILVIDFQALYVGRVRVGFDIGGKIVVAHEFTHANQIAVPYIQNASLPIRCGMTCTATVSTTMRFICSAVASEGGQEETGGVPVSATVTASGNNGVDTHALSLRPLTAFSGITNRVKLVLDSIEVLTTGTSPVLYKICIGQAITSSAYAAVNATYSAFELSSAGTLSGTPALVIQSGYAAATASGKSVSSPKIASKIPITLGAAGAVRANGTLTVLVQGVGGTAPCSITLNWRELR